ncbi:hypothetical protein ACLOJK_008302 [Asimina triloba]
MVEKKRWVLKRRIQLITGERRGWRVRRREAGLQRKGSGKHRGKDGVGRGGGGVKNPYHGCRRLTRKIKKESGRYDEKPRGRKALKRGKKKLAQSLNFCRVKRPRWDEMTLKK